MKRPSGSSFWLLTKCPASHALAQAATDNDAADIGRKAHRVLEPIVLGCAPVPEGLAELKLAMGEGSCAEVALAYDVETGKVRFLGMGLDRKYGDLGPTEIPMTIDYLRVEEDRVVIRDWKTGESWLERADSHPQLRLCALAACRHFGKDKAEIGWVKFSPKAFEEDGSLIVVHHDSAELDVFDLDDLAEEVRKAWRSWREAVAMVEAGRTPNVTPDEHCRWCSAFHVCPAKQSLAKSIASAINGGGLGTLLPDEKGKAYALIIVAQQVLARARAEIEVGVMETGDEVPLPDGRILRVVTGPAREQVVDAKAVARRLAVIGSEVALQACELKASKASIERALRAADATDQIRPILAELREAGVIQKRPGQARVEPVEDRPALPAPEEAA